MNAPDFNLFHGLRPELLDRLVEEGVGVFRDATHFPHGVPRYSILAWLFTACALEGLSLSVLERDQVVGRVHAQVNSVMDFGRAQVLTAQVLRELLAGLPENTPVLYQRLEDVLFEKNGWTAVPLPWGGLHEASAEDIEAIRRDKPRYCDLVERDGKTYVRELSDYVPAFGAYLVTDDAGRRAVCIHAHY